MPGLLLLVLGLLAAWLAVPWLPHWSEAPSRLRLHLVVFLAAGIPAAVCGIALLANRGVRLAGWAGGTAAVICGTNLIAGTALGSIPCGSPT